MEGGGICLVAQSLSYVARTKTANSTTFHILKNVDLIAKPGEFTAIMGPSGSGKTSLLNIISGRTRNVLIDYITTTPDTTTTRGGGGGGFTGGGGGGGPTTTTSAVAPAEAAAPAFEDMNAIKKAPIPYGRILINGHPVSYPELRSLSRYVMQSDCLLPYLSVYETIRFAAQLKLPHLTKEERNEKVEDVLKKLSLQSCRDVIIGDQIQKGISGGQRKRVSIALELLEDPKLLFLDEPTSGLDSSLAFDVIQTVVKLLKKKVKGMTVICTIHQPRKQIFDMFDKLALMSKGEIVYQGPAKQITKFWALANHPMPSHQNVADWSLDLLNDNTHTDDDIKKPYKTNSSIRNLLERAGSFVAADPLSHDISGINLLKENVGSFQQPGGSRIRDDEVVVGASAPVRAVISAEDIALLPRIFQSSEWGVRVQKEIHESITSMRSSSLQDVLPARRKVYDTNRMWKFIRNSCTLTHRFFLNRVRNKFGLMILMFVNLFITLFTAFIFYKISLPKSSTDCTAFYNCLGFAASIGIGSSFSVMQNWMNFPQGRPMINRERAGGLYNSWALHIGMILGDLPILCIPGIISTLATFWIVGFGSNQAEYFFYFLIACISMSFAATGWIMLAVFLAPSPPAATVLAPVGIVLAVLLSGLWITDNAMPKVWLGIRYITWIRYGVNGILINRFGKHGVVKECGTMPTYPDAAGNIGCLWAIGAGFRLLAGFALSKLHTRQGLEA